MGYTGEAEGVPGIQLADIGFIVDKTAGLQESGTEGWDAMVQRLRGGMARLPSGRIGNWEVSS